MTTPIEVAKLIKSIETDNALVKSYSHLEEKDIARALFLNYRGKDVPRGLRLTDEGLLVLKSLFDSWHIEYEESYRPQLKHILALDRKTTMPWHLKKNVLTFFEARLAMNAKLTGTLENFYEIFLEPEKTS